MRALGFVPVDLGRIERAVREGEELPDRAFHVTFDDGYQNVAQYGLPVCEEFGVRPTVFVISGFIGQTSRWDLSIPRRRHLDWSELRDLSGRGVSIGGHSVSHPFLTRLDVDAAVGEIDGCRKALEDGLGAGVTAFTYPYGAYSPWLARVVEDAGYQVAFTMDATQVVSSETRFTLPRVGVYAIDSRRSLSAKVGLRGRRAWRLACATNRWIRLCAYGNLITRK